MRKTIIYLLLIIVASNSCLEPYDYRNPTNENLLVVDALITNEPIQHSVILSRSSANISDNIIMESGAYVAINDSKGNTQILTETEAGIYKTDISTFQAIVGESYTLNIKTSDGKQYQSETCQIQSPSTIESITYKPGKEWNKSKTNEDIGIHILVNGEANKDQYLRWIYEEDWKFRVPFPTRDAYDYQTGTWIPIDAKNVYCYKNESSTRITTHSFANQASSELKNKEICFVPSEATDKLTIRYSILVKQLSISKDEYDFWKKLELTSNDVDDFSGTQPFSIHSNIKNINDRNEKVLGYFQTASVASKRLYIDYSEMIDANVPLLSPSDYCSEDEWIYYDRGYDSVLELYEDLVINGSFYLSRLIYSASGAVIGIAITVPRCADCTFTGNINKPDFWED